MAEFGAGEVVNISKIKDGFFVGDEATASNLDVIITFKITHIINACGNQVMNAWETIGMKYLTLNWTENINQVIDKIIRICLTTRMRLQIEYKDSSMTRLQMEKDY